MSHTGIVIVKTTKIFYGDDKIDVEFTMIKNEEVGRVTRSCDLGSFIFHAKQLISELEEHDYDVENGGDGE
jgi:hypothetical protein